MKYKIIAQNSKLCYFFLVISNMNQHKPQFKKLIQSLIKIKSPTVGLLHQIENRITALKS